MAILLLMAAGTPRGQVVLDVLVCAALLALSLRFRVGPLVLLALVLMGAETRLAHVGFGESDVLAVTSAAIERFLDGGNPYGVGYPISQPAGAPFAYGPLALLWYLPLRDEPQILETIVSIAILVLLALRGGALGLAAYAFVPALIVSAGDGSNDTSAGLFLLLALAAVPSRPLLGALLLAVAAAFKPYAAAWAPAAIAFGGRAALLGFVAVTAVLWGPALLLYGPSAILASFALSQSIHPAPYYSLGAALEAITHRPVPRQALDLFRLLAGAGTALLTAPWVRTGGAVVTAGLAVYLVTLYAGYWSTFSYLAAAAPALCWHLDEWTGLDEGRIRWPGDPFGRVGRALDRRWPKGRRSREPA